MSRFEDISSKHFFNSFTAAKPHGRPGRRSKRGRWRLMKRGSAAGRTPSLSKTPSVTDASAASGYVESPLATQLSDSSMIVDDKKDWYQHPAADASFLTGNY